MVLQSSRKLHHSWSGEREIGLATELFIRDGEFAFFGNNGSWKEQIRQRLPLCEVKILMLIYSKRNSLCIRYHKEN
jgi:hypothetical protein